MADSSRCLTTWHTHNHPELAARKPDELFEPEFAKRYTRLQKLLWKRIVSLHETLLTLEELADFPFEAIYPSTRMSFWRLVVDNFRSMFCITLHALTEDQVDGSHTLARFKNEIRKATWREASLREAFDMSLSECRFDDEIKSISRRMRDIRHHRVAHLLVDHSTGGLKGVMEGVSLEEQRRLFTAVHALFGILSFGASYVTLTWDLVPSTTGGKSNQSCLTSVLDSVLKDCYIVNQPEIRADWWKGEREYIKPQELELMNQLRARVGKPPA